MRGWPPHCQPRAERSSEPCCGRLALISSARLAIRCADACRFSFFFSFPPDEGWRRCWPRSRAVLHGRPAGEAALGEGLGRRSDVGSAHRIPASRHRCHRGGRAGNGRGRKRADEEPAWGWLPRFRKAEEARGDEAAMTNAVLGQSEIAVRGVVCWFAASTASAPAPILYTNSEAMSREFS